MFDDLSRRDFLAKLALAGLALPTGSLLAGCGGGSAGPAPSPSSGAAGNVLFWTRETFDSGVREPLIKARLAAFDRSHGTSSQAEFMVYAESVSKTQAALAAGTPPDLGQQGPDVALQFAAGDNLLPIDDLYNSMKDQFLPLQKDAFVRYQGKTYGVPWYIETRVLFYHKDLLAKVGVNPPTTWAEWLTAARALTKGEDQAGFVMPGQGTFPGQLFIPLGTSAGPALLDKDGKPNATSDGFHSALQFLADLYSSKAMPRATPTYKESDALQLFLLKKAAMFWYNGSLLQAVATQMPDLMANIGAVKTPVQKVGDVSRSFLGGFCLFVFKKGKNPEGAKQLLKYLFEPSWYADYLQHTQGAALPSTGAAASAKFYDSGAVKSLVEQAKTAVRYGGPVYGNAPFLGQAEGTGLFSNTVVDVWTGKRSVAESLTNLDSALKKLAQA